MPSYSKLRALFKERFTGNEADIAFDICRDDEQLRNTILAGDDMSRLSALKTLEIRVSGRTQETRRGIASSSRVGRHQTLYEREGDIDVDR